MSFSIEGGQVEVRGGVADGDVPVLGAGRRKALENGEIAPSPPARYTRGMNTKQGRPRRFDFGSDASVGQELAFVVDFLDELAVRVDDQISHLPAEALNFVGPNSTLSIGRLVLHLVGADLKMLSAMVGPTPLPPYQARLDKGMLTDFASPPGDLSFAGEVMKEHLEFRRPHLLDRCRIEGFLERSVDHPACRTNRELLAHAVWHWSYHSGQIGLIALEAGYDYVWSMTPR